MAMGSVQLSCTAAAMGRLSSMRVHVYRVAPVTHTSARQPLSIANKPVLFCALEANAAQASKTQAIAGA
jgi:hypothetical protein